MSFAIVDGFYTGLQLPDKRPETFAAYRSANQVLSRDQIRQILSNPDRTTARQRFPANMWIRNQGRRGSCNGYAGAWSLARARVNAGLDFAPLSGEYLYSMINDGRDAGSMLNRGMEALTEKGVAREDLVRHESYLWRDMSSEARVDAANHKGFECYRVDDESELASGLALGFVGVVAVHANSSYRRLDARGVRGTSVGPGNHAVGVQDVRIGDDGDFEFDEVGSWGRSNGQDGYAWLTWKQHLRSTVERHAFYLIRAASDPLNSSVPKVK
jgi:hypothetical protein